MTGSFCKEDIFMGSIIYGLLATTLIWESSAGPWLIIGQFTSSPWRYNQQRGEAGAGDGYQTSNGPMVQYAINILCQFSCSFGNLKDS